MLSTHAADLYTEHGINPYPPGRSTTPRSATAGYPASR